MSLIIRVVCDFAKYHMYQKQVKRETFNMTMNFLSGAL